MLRYTVGDEVTASMKLWHRMNLLGVDVVFEHREDSAITLILSGVPELVGYVPPQEQPEGATLPGQTYRTSEVPLSGEVGLEHIPGEYTASRAEFYTASGQEIQYDLRADKPIPSRISVRDRAFRVVEEPRMIDGADFELTYNWLEEEPSSAD